MKSTRICKVCGKEYPFCRTERPKGTFVYQEVACCKEHAAEYFASIAASRNENKAEQKYDETVVIPEEKLEEPEFDTVEFVASEIIEDYDDDEFADDEEDDDDDFVEDDE